MPILVRPFVANYGSRAPGGGVAFCGVSDAPFKSRRCMSCFRRSRARRLFAASGVGCKDRGTFRLPFFFRMFLTGIGWISDMSFLFGTSFYRGKSVVFRLTLTILERSGILQLHPLMRADAVVIGLRPSRPRPRPRRRRPDSSSSISSVLPDVFVAILGLFRVLAARLHVVRSSLSSSSSSSSSSVWPPPASVELCRISGCRIWPPRCPVHPSQPATPSENTKMSTVRGPPTAAKRRGISRRISDRPPRTEVATSAIFAASSWFSIRFSETPGKCSTMSSAASPVR